MPIYEYSCRKGHVTDVLVSFADKPIWLECETCGGIAEPLFTTPALHNLAYLRAVRSGKSYVCTVDSFRFGTKTYPFKKRRRKV